MFLCGTIFFYLMVLKIPFFGIYVRNRVADQIFHAVPPTTRHNQRAQEAAVRKSGFFRHSKLSGHGRRPIGPSNARLADPAVDGIGGSRPDLRQLIESAKSSYIADTRAKPDGPCHGNTGYVRSVLERNPGGETPYAQRRGAVVIA